MVSPIHARTKAGGQRKYVDPQDSSISYPSVTTILGALAKPALPAWAAKEVATFAVAQRQAWADLDDDAAIALLKGAPWRSRDKAASLGTAVHDAAEAWMLDKPMPPWPDNVEPFMEQFVEWLSDFAPDFEMVEATVANPQLGYAGTLDAIVTLPSLGKTILVDYKTGKGVYPEVALQLAAYRHATEVWLPDGTKAPMPKTHGGAVLHLRPDAYSFVPVRTDKSVLRAFRAACAAAQWKDSGSLMALGEPLVPVRP